MKLFYDFLPIALFFITYKMYGIFIATGVAIAASIIQVGAYWLKFHRTETMQIITLISVLILGGITLFLHNALFIKWKPSIIYWAFGIVFISSQFFGKRNLIQRLMDNKVQLPQFAWNRLNISWAIFFIILGFVNLYVVYHFSTDTWVNFKLFGTLGLMVLFVILQSVYMSRYISEPKNILKEGRKT